MRSPGGSIEYEGDDGAEVEVVVEAVAELGQVAAEMFAIQGMAGAC